ncbi:MAG: hypothetical protein DRI70_09330 [Bacteroidetes bacterium]|nr:MAG: hypothetical protein DRI70_09330 [Bacteroidota bacterium]
MWFIAHYPLFISDFRLLRLWQIWTDRRASDFRLPTSDLYQNIFILAINAKRELNEEERDELKFKWAKKTIKRVDEIIERFQNKKKS